MRRIFTVIVRSSFATVLAMALVVSSQVGVAAATVGEDGKVSFTEDDVVEISDASPAYRVDDGNIVTNTASSSGAAVEKVEGGNGIADYNHSFQEVPGDPEEVSKISISGDSSNYYKLWDTGNEYVPVYITPGLESGYIYVVSKSGDGFVLTKTEVTPDKSCEEVIEEAQEESDSSSKTVYQPTPEEQARITTEMEGVVGTTAYTNQQKQVTNLAQQVVAIYNGMKPAQRKDVERIGVLLDVGGCTSFSNVATMALLGATNQEEISEFVTPMPYTIKYTWKGLNITIIVPKGANLSQFVGADGSLQFYKLAAKYGYTAVLAK